MSTVKRYLLFWFAQFYPSGGWNDLEGSFDTIEDALAVRENLKKDRFYGDFQLIDGHTGAEIK